MAGLSRDGRGGGSQACGAQLDAPHAVAVALELGIDALCQVIACLRRAAHVAVADEFEPAGLIEQLQEESRIVGAQPPQPHTFGLCYELQVKFPRPEAQTAPAALSYAWAPDDNERITDYERILAGKALVACVATHMQRLCAADAVFAAQATGAPTSQTPPPAQEQTPVEVYKGPRTKFVHFPDCGHGSRAVDAHLCGDLDAGIAGWAESSFMIDTQGRPYELTVTRSTGNPKLNEVARNVVTEADSSPHR